MVLAYHAIEHNEAEIYAGCQTDLDGTLPTAAAHYVQRLGLEASALRLMGLEDLQERIALQAIIPIVFVHLAPLLGLNAIHAVVIEAMDGVAKNIQLIDP